MENTDADADADTNYNADDNVYVIRIRIRFIAIIIAVIVVLIVYYYVYEYSEHYANKEEKDQTIANWFSKQSDPKYSNYKVEVPKSDIVEYLDAKTKYSK